MRMNYIRKFAKLINDWVITLANIKIIESLNYYLLKNKNQIDQAASYGAYHHNNVNKFIHIVFVPAILYTAFVMLSFVNVPQAVPYLQQLNQITTFLPVSITTPIALLISLYYCVLDIRVGVVGLAWIMAANYLAEYTILHMSNAFMFALGVHIVSWVLQFVGHGVFEGRRPALVDNIFQVFIAPFFVTLECIFLLGLMGKTQVAVEKRIISNIASMSKKTK
ncbi:hypothetical protein PPL_10441 [Heterostelium album PN500]|uniref:Endoplasmic reticulum membrane protein n=1 Tax=Heterostelium pallidum (strain ATCC 26659 / Pp 5 / PN500) TaxID=670386 RepID=D3BR37_HETP5|nr:hypothetical protein PPL_10441 [Heterostelium album PN500]EFA75869.1 hypothetical protein PPL_10441 [Heterostelium album PN500]|eukprot:XP_020428003.1 hypothetical protein PPL_10441 [Heterostelium album PN500]